jgi:DNA-binding NtrC family response regulator
MPQLLVLDDEPEICELVRAAFENQPLFAVAAAHNAEDALSILSRERIDLALIDILMRGHSGLEVAERAVAQDIPILIMTGDLELCSALAECDCPLLRKPFKLMALRGLVRQLVADPSENRLRAQQCLRHLTTDKSALERATREGRRTVAAMLRDAQRPSSREEASRREGALGPA